MTAFGDINWVCIFKEYISVCTCVFLLFVPSVSMSWTNITSDFFFFNLSYGLMRKMIDLIGLRVNFWGIYLETHWWRKISYYKTYEKPLNVGILISYNVDYFLIKISCKSNSNNLQKSIPTPLHLFTYNLIKNINK